MSNAIYGDFQDRLTGLLVNRCDAGEIEHEVTLEAEWLGLSDICVNHREGMNFSDVTAVCRDGYEVMCRIPHALREAWDKGEIDSAVFRAVLSNTSGTRVPSELGIHVGLSDLAPHPEWPCYWELPAIGFCPDPDKGVAIIRSSVWVSGNDGVYKDSFKVTLPNGEEESYCFWDDFGSESPWDWQLPGPDLSVADLLTYGLSQTVRYTEMDIERMRLPRRGAARKA